MNPGPGAEAPGLFSFMAFTFMASGPGAIRGDQITLTRFCGPESGKFLDRIRGRRHCLQLSFDPAGAPFDVRFKHCDIQITRDEAIVLRDNLTRFIDGVQDGELVSRFTSARERNNKLIL